MISRTLTKPIECFAVISHKIKESSNNASARMVERKILCKVEVPMGAKMKKSLFGTFKVTKSKILKIIECSDNDLITDEDLNKFDQQLFKYPHVVF